METIARYTPKQIITEGICPLCRQKKTLSRSHILPNASFRKIKRQNSGKLVSFDDSAYTPVGHTVESWWEYLLCHECEQVLSVYESYSIGILRKMARDSQFHSAGITLKNFDYAKLKLFFTSLLWRAAVSSQDAFSKVIVPDLLLEEARSSIYSGDPLNAKKFGCRIVRLFDPKPENEGGFSDNDLEQLIISPIPRRRARFISYIFVIEGYLLEFFVPSIPLSKSSQLGVLKNTNVLYISKKDIFKVEELVTIMVSGYRKADLGMVMF